MTSDAIRKAFHANRPFKVITVDGKAFDIPHRDFAALSQNGRTLLVMTPDDTWEMLDVFSISALEGLDSTSAA